MLLAIWVCLTGTDLLSLHIYMQLSSRNANITAFYYLHSPETISYKNVIFGLGSNAVITQVLYKKKSKSQEHVKEVIKNFLELGIFSLLIIVSNIVLFCT